MYSATVADLVEPYGPDAQARLLTLLRQVRLLGGALGYTVAMDEPVLRIEIALKRACQANDVLDDILLDGLCSALERDSRVRDWTWSLEDGTV